jgi:hypothetical protein
MSTKSGSVRADGESTAHILDAAGGGGLFYLAG